MVPPWNTLFSPVTGFKNTPWSFLEDNKVVEDLPYLSDKTTPIW